VSTNVTLHQGHDVAYFTHGQHRGGCAGANAEAAELSRRVQARLIQLGTVGHPQTALSDGNQAGPGDLIRARLNTEIDAGGRKLTNRDTLKITALRGPEADPVVQATRGGTPSCVMRCGP
jgi:hypothetical protein